jgi:hypothetical protein
MESTRIATCPLDPLAACPSKVSDNEPARSAVSLAWTVPVRAIGVAARMMLRPGVEASSVASMPSSRAMTRSSVAAGSLTSDCHLPSADSSTVRSNNAVRFEREESQAARADEMPNAQARIKAYGTPSRRAAHARNRVAPKRVVTTCVAARLAAILATPCGSLSPPRAITPGAVTCGNGTRPFY